jgi:CHAT domain-containing protein
VLSLSWSFLVAGAGAVLSSLWRVDDQSAARFMAAFYATLHACRDPAVALARAQRTLIASGEANAPAEHGPEYWASFVLTGSGHLFV